MNIIPNVTKRSEVKVGDTCTFVFEDSKINIGTYSNMKVSEIKTTKTGMIKLTFSGIYTSSEGEIIPTKSSFSLGKADSIAVERR